MNKVLYFDVRCIAKVNIILRVPFLLFITLKLFSLKTHYSISREKKKQQMKGVKDISKR